MKIRSNCAPRQQLTVKIWYETRIRYFFYLNFLLREQFRMFFMFLLFSLWTIHCQCNGQQTSLSGFRRNRRESYSEPKFPFNIGCSHLRSSWASHPVLKQPIKFSETESSRQSSLYMRVLCAANKMANQP